MMALKGTITDYTMCLYRLYNVLIAPQVDSNMLALTRLELQKERT